MKLNPFSKKKKAAPEAAGTRPALQATFSQRLSNDAFLDWTLILAIGFVFALALVASGVYVYLGTGQELTDAKAGGPAKKLTLPLDEKALRSALGEYDRRASVRAAIERGFSAPKDPSLP